MTRGRRIVRVLILIGAAAFWMGLPRPPGLPGCRGPRPPHPFHEASNPGAPPAGDALRTPGAADTSAARAR
jgi:hypothetical protein